MNPLRKTLERPWRITIAAVGGLLVAIIVAGLVGFLLNRSIERAANDALRYDAELEDEGDDLRVAVLEMRHYHRNLYFQARGGQGATRVGVEDFERAYEDLMAEIEDYAEIQVREPDIPKPQEFRRMAGEYYSEFRSAIPLAESDPQAFEDASDLGLRRLAEMNAAAERVDDLGERLTDASLRNVDRVATTATFVLLAAICGLLLAGAALSYAAVRVVSELRRLYDEQHEAAEKLTEAARAKTEFIADVSHELRTPLTVLRGNAQVGLATTDEPEQREILQEIVEESKRMSRMVEDLLLLAKSDSASLQLDLEPVAVGPLLSTLAGRAESLARQRGAALERDLEGKGLVRVDAQRIEQAVLVLVDNAAKYGPPGGPVRLASRTTRHGELRIIVEDRGPGIPKRELPRIFERFYRVDKVRTRKGNGEGPGQGGVGLGLPIARTIIQAHGGRIEAASREGEGTRMSLYLPLLPAPEPALQEADGSSEPRGSARS